jgi:hypothetical protein
MQHYYNQLFSIPGSGIEAVSQDLKSIEDYLSSAIFALKKKEAIQASWRKLSDPQGQLHLLGSLYRIPKQEVVLSMALRGYSEGEYIDVRGNKYFIVQKKADDKAVFDRHYEGEDLYAKDNSLHEGKIEVLKPIYQLVDEGETDYIVYLKNGEQVNNSDSHRLPNEEVINYLSRVTHLRYKENSLRIVIDNDSCVNLDEQLKGLVNQDFITEPYNLPIVLKYYRQNGRCDGRWIQLIELEEGNVSGEEETYSPLRHFFDDDIAIQDNYGNLYDVLKGIDDEYLLRLHKMGDKRLQDCYPPEGAILSVRVNTYQLSMQREAVQILRERPLKAHWPLLKLFLSRELINWEKCDPVYPHDWQVLTDNSRSGCQEQRNFVAKALGTPDYAFLAGPPGSGKTTVILELICQLIAKKKRILLCSSTHVAIDNVLERLDESGLIERFDITALRVGDKGRISERVTHFQIDEVLKDCSEDMHRLIRQSSNLVCGTTMGILQYPDFKREKKDGEKDPSPIVPDFDYLIIDESSKTTFQEFLVPALRAKHWILVGDVLQLSPYTELELVEANICQLRIHNKRISEEQQQAIYLLHQLESFYSIWSKETLRGQYAIPVSKDVLALLRNEYEAGRGQKIFDGENYVLAFVGIDNYEKYNRLLLSGYDIIFIERGIEEKGLIPETHAVLWSKKPTSWERSNHSFQFRALESELKSSFTSKGNYRQNHRAETLEELINRVSQDIYSRSWASEIAWRIDREHQTRLQDQYRSKSYAKQIGELMPLEDRGLWISAVNRLAAIAFPSILEALERGIITRKKEERGQGSTLVEGFDEKAILERREILTYQHRMHPEISCFPRERFYYSRPGQNEALLDNAKLKREWDYSLYPRRNYWIDVKGRDYRGANEVEAKRMMQELDKFTSYAQTAQPNDNPQRSWTVACLCFYRGQERIIKKLLQEKTGNRLRSTHFHIEGVQITLCTVDRFQGQEADVVFLSMVRTKGVGFMDSPNRLNVALTRARYQNVIIGDRDNFTHQKVSEDLKQLALYASGEDIKVRNANNKTGTRWTREQNSSKRYGEGDRQVSRSWQRNAHKVQH